MRVSKILRTLPRIKTSSLALTHQVFHEKYDCIPKGCKSKTHVVIRGRLTNKRWAGKQLGFFDVSNNGYKIQAVAQEVAEKVESVLKSLSKGSHVEIKGIPGRSESGELSIFATDVIKLSDCMHRLPEQYQDVEKRRRNRHIDFLVNSKSADIIRLRSLIISTLRRFLEKRSFMEVETPILQSSASGAAARPFVTTSIMGPTAQLRISPELALKRAVVGGFERVYEIGKCFRNERLSRRHQPEFTTCEFYQAYANLDDLIDTTKKLLVELEDVVQKDKRFDHYFKKRLFVMDSFQVVDFMVSLRDILKVDLPSTEKDLLALFDARGIPIPNDTSIVNLYDTLADKYLAPLCSKQPTFLINFPAAMSPLAKSTDGIAHRFELYVNGMELINAYEEENDPILQRQKFIQQNGSLTPEEEEYCIVLEYGLPATGGWGMGIDRLVMLLTKTESINDVILSGGFTAQFSQLAVRPRSRIDASSSPTSSEPELAK